MSSPGPAGAINPNSVESVTVSAPQTGPTNFAIPQCFVDIYPYEGGPYSFTGGQVLRCQTSKNIKATSPGEFAIQLAPESLSNNLSWGQVLTPLSTVIIGMSRAGKSSIVMIGVITKVEENQTWQQGNATLRTITIRGNDTGYFFNLNDYYTLFFLASINVNNDQGIGALALGNFTGDPGKVAAHWYNQIMVGTKALPGVFLNMGLPYKNGNPQNNAASANILLSSLFGTLFETYDATIPLADYFLGVNGAWQDKFRLILPFPFYEFFVTTTANNAYALASGGTPLSVTGLGAGITATPEIIGRINPVPSLVTSVTGGLPQTSPVMFDSIDTSAWNALPSFDVGDLNFIKSSISFSEESVSNFFNINFPYFGGLNGANNTNLNIPIYNYQSAADRASINRYGYRPLDLSIQWFSDPNGDAAKAATQAGDGGGAGNSQLYAKLIGRAAGYYEAAPLMANADVQLPLRPDIQIGTKFSYTPYRSGELWDFYIEGVMHDYAFGAGTSTQLTLTRGLPHSVYEDSGAGGKLFAIHTGNAQRVGGEYVVGLPNGSAASLASVPIGQFITWMSQATRQYITPQYVAPASGTP
jgi:hypothetical protein